MNEKKLAQKLMSILLVLLSIIVIIVAFVGVYLKNLNKLSNVIPDATYSSEINGIIEYRLSVDDTETEEEVYVDEDGNVMGHVDDGNDTSDDDWENETGYTIETQTIKTNNDEDLTSENYEKVKSIISDRLDEMGATEYSIRVDEETGDLNVELSENDNIDYLYQTAVCLTGEFRIIDYQTGVVLMDDSHLVEASTYTYSSDGSSYTVYLLLEFDDEGTEIIKNMSNEYVETTDDEGDSEINYIAIQIDGSSIYRTYFGEEYDSSTLMIPLGSDITDADELESYQTSVSAYATILNLESLPITYDTDSSGGYLIQSPIDDNYLVTLKIVGLVALVLIVVILTIRYKFKGFLAGIFNAAFAGLLLLILKYLEIVISISAMFAFVVMILLNVFFFEKYLKLLKTDEEDAFKKALKSYYSVIFPIIVVAFVFTVATVSGSVTGIGMVLFWGLILQILFNLIISRYVLNKKEK